MSWATTSAVGQPVEQRRLAGVGVADQRHGRERHPPARRALQAAGAPHLLQLALQLADAARRSGGGRFDLGFAGTAHDPEAAALALQVGPGADQARALVGRAAPARPAAGLRAVRARRAKISRIRPVRSMTFAFQAFSRLRCWTGVSCVVDHHDVDLLDLARSRRSPRPCRLPNRVAGVSWRRGTTMVSRTSRSRARARPTASSQPRRRDRAREPTGRSGPGWITRAPWTGALDGQRIL